MLLNYLPPKQATISNPNTSQAAKEHSRQAIQEFEGQNPDITSSRQPRVDDVDEEEEEATVETNPPNVLGGSAYHEGVLGDTRPAGDPFLGKDPTRVLAGYKATLHSECSFLWLPHRSVRRRRANVLM
jgi:hypothetical protein